MRREYKLYLEDILTSIKAVIDNAYLIPRWEVALMNYKQQLSFIAKGKGLMI